MAPVARWRYSATGKACDGRSDGAHGLRPFRLLAAPAQHRCGQEAGREDQSAAAPRGTEDVHVQEVLVVRKVPARGRRLPRNN